MSVTVGRHPTLLKRGSELRDGRWIPGESKSKNIFALQRFLARGGGYFCNGADATLKDVGLEDMMPVHYGRWGTSAILRFSNP